MFECAFSNVLCCCCSITCGTPSRIWFCTGHSGWSSSCWRLCGCALPSKCLCPTAPSEKNILPKAPEKINSQWIHVLYVWKMCKNSKDFNRHASTAVAEVFLCSLSSCCYEPVWFIAQWRMFQEHNYPISVCHVQWEQHRHRIHHLLCASCTVWAFVVCFCSSDSVYLNSCI